MIQPTIETENKNKNLSALERKKEELRRKKTNAPDQGKSEEEKAIDSYLAWNKNEIKDGIKPLEFWVF